MDNRYTLLIVDDNAIAREGIKDLLKACDYPLTVLDAADGNQAQLLLEQEQIDILMADVEMPVISGIELGKIAREANPDICIIMFSAYSKFEYARSAISIDALEYLLKPIDLDQFGVAIEKAIRRCDQHRAALAQAHEKKEFASEKHSVPYGQKVMQIMEIIRAEYQTDLSLDDLAKRMYLTKSYTCYLFKNETGMTIKGFLNQCRMEKALDLLRTTNMKVVDVAAAVGYSSSIYFHSLFKKMYGMTPLQIRTEEDGM